MLWLSGKSTEPRTAVFEESGIRSPPLISVSVVCLCVTEEDDDVVEVTWEEPVAR